MRRTVFCLLSFCLLFVGPALAGPKPERSRAFAVESFGEPALKSFDAHAYLQAQQELFKWLVSEKAPGAEESRLVVEPSPEDLKTLETGICESCGPDDAGRKTLVGVALAAQRSVNFQRLSTLMLRRTGSQAVSGGVARAAADGGMIWTTVLESKGATAVRVHLTGLDLPPNAELYVYNSLGEAFGPYTDQGPSATGELWSNTLSGSEAFLQLRTYGSVTRNLRFEIKNLAHIGPKFLLPSLQNPDPGRAFCNFNEPCVEDANCHNGVSAVSDARDAVAHIQFVSGAFIYICSGGLVADTDGSTQIPYFLTANHCISKNNEANSMEAFFQFETSGCGGACYNPVGAVPRTMGASILSKSKTSDYTFMQLDENAPSGSAFLGWSATAVANTNNADLYRISHPSGAPQAYSSHEVDTSAGTCGGWPRGNWIYSRDVTGATEGGSSGSPVLNANGQIVGQLTGACGFNVNDPCDSGSNATVDGAFAAYYTNILQWLDPSGGPGGGSTMHVSQITLTIQNQGPRVVGRANVTVVDDNGDPVSGASVSGSVTGAGLNLSLSGNTNNQGVATLKTPKVNSLAGATFCVTNINHGSLTYEPNDNVETCENF